ncbi:MAG: L,D-transpeptidase [Bacillota bacterium]|nr:L,D-transpeptidase [Bacillota bacterium]
MYRIDINTKKLKLLLIKEGTLIKEYPIAVGKPSTPTPLGHWQIIKKGLWGQQFGGHFMQLSVPWGTYGIHGTNKPNSISKYVTHGCIRMYKNNAAELYNKVSIGTPVNIY